MQFYPTLKGKLPIQKVYLLSTLENLKNLAWVVLISEVKWKNMMEDERKLKKIIIVTYWAKWKKLIAEKVIVHNINVSIISHKCTWEKHDLSCLFGILTNKKNTE